MVDIIKIYDVAIAEDSIYFIREVLSNAGEGLGVGIEIVGV